MHTKSLIKQLLKIDRIVIDSAYFDNTDGEEVFVVKSRTLSRDAHHCPHCGKRCQGYDSGNTTRRWRTLDFGSTKTYIEACSPRVSCSEHGVVVAKVPWARHNSDYTYDFETAVTWFALHATSEDVSNYFRIKWATVGSIAKRVQESLEAEKPSRFDNLERIGIDETSYKKGHKYMTVVVDHNTGHLIWAKKGHGKEILTAFFKELNEEQRANIKLVSADGARWIADCITDFCPNAERCIDPFHVVAWANDCLDEVRKSAIRQAKQDASEDKKPERTKAKKKMKIPRIRNTHY